MGFLDGVKHAFCRAYGFKPELADEKRVGNSKWYYRISQGHQMLHALLGITARPSPASIDFPRDKVRHGCDTLSASSKTLCCHMRPELSLDALE
jgi:hypothetical protein